MLEKVTSIIVSEIPLVTDKSPPVEPEYSKRFASMKLPLLRFNTIEIIAPDASREATILSREVLTWENILLVAAVLDELPKIQVLWNVLSKDSQ